MIIISGAGLRMELNVRPCVSPNINRSIKASQTKRPCSLKISCSFSSEWFPKEEIQQ